MGLKSIDRFWKNVEVKSENECWRWKKTLTNGYGRFGINKMKISAHRFSYMISKGTIFPDMVVHHVCENKSCVNPSHLKQVTVAENTKYHYNGNGW